MPKTKGSKDTKYKSWHIGVTPERLAILNEIDAENKHLDGSVTKLFDVALKAWQQLQLLKQMSKGDGFPP